MYSKGGVYNSTHLPGEGSLNATSSQKQQVYTTNISNLHDHIDQNNR